MAKIIISPGTYVQGKGEIKKLNEYFKRLGNKKAYIIIDEFIYKTYKDEIEESFKEAGSNFESVVFGGECSESEIDKHVKNLGESDVVIGIGGGKTLDTTKAVGYHTDKPVIIVPTAASSDAPCSRLSVIYTDDGVFDSYLYLKKNPDIVAMDTDIIAHAPVRFLVAGIGDALATYYEATACYNANAIAVSGGHITQAAITLAGLCLETLLKDGLKAKAAAENKVVTKALENVVEANTYLSGIGFESSGIAAAHAIHNGFTVIEEMHSLLHGEKVAFGTITQMVLENRDYEELEKIINFCKTLGLPTNFDELGIPNVKDEELMEVAKVSCSEDDTMSNMPFDVTPEDVFAAMKTADQISRNM